ncbi:MAG: peptidase S8 [Chloroflexi bacterium]|nr:MAG: peptidase S8 [Chloroflexota bacterium]
MRRIRRLLMAGSLLLASAPMVAAVQTAHAGTQQTYLVVYSQQAVPAGAPATISSAGGTLVASYGAIGVAVARSDSSAFRDNVMKDSKVEGVAATGGFATQLNDGVVGDTTTSTDTATPAPGNDTLSSLQWDMDQINAPAARAINGGSPSVTVGDIDTGIDYTHPDLAANVDFGKSVSCIGGVQDTTPAAWKDDHGHGTHTAGTIAAAKNGIGIVGVAPNVKIAAIKAGNADGFFFPEAVVCAFMWAGTHNIQVTNNSYFADPWLFNCKNDPGQRAIWNAERRAIKFAQQSGTVVVAAIGNQADDVAHPTQDATSPDDTIPVERRVTNACAVVPVEVPGVIGVSGDGNKLMKSFFSSYGVGSTQVVAPSGDSILQVTAAAPNGRVLSTWPSYMPCTRKVIEGTTVYCYLQGTSMASPHVAGVAALIVSMGITSPGAVTARINNTADPMACPTDVSVYAPFPATDNGAPQTCQGGIGYNSWFGHGQVNALKAVGG